MRLLLAALFLFACDPIVSDPPDCGARTFLCGDRCCQDGTESCLRTTTRDEVVAECVPLLPNCTSCPCVQVDPGCRCGENRQRVYVDCER